MPEKGHKINKFANYQNITVPPSTAMFLFLLNIGLCFFFFFIYFSFLFEVMRLVRGASSVDCLPDFGAVGSDKSPSGTYIPRLK